VQFIFAGKAHPADKAGQYLIKRIVEVSLLPRFIGKIIFIPGYDITLAKAMVQGVDVWMNTPTRPMEASGTSGEKAVMNGVMHFSVLDGWWVEGYTEGAGWALPQFDTYSDPGFQNELDAATIYNIIENEIAPLFYDNDLKTNLPEQWITTIKTTVAKVASNFTTNRMLEDYCRKYYNPLAERSSKVKADDFTLARELAFWKKRVRREWPNVEVRSYTRLDISKSEINVGNAYPVNVELFIGGLSPEEIGFELLVAQESANGGMSVKQTYDFILTGFKDGVASFSSEIRPEIAGVFNLAGRIYPKNSYLPHRQDFDLVKWL
jgi:phosphorylase/glycogen(starch) synthase